MDGVLSTRRRHSAELKNRVLAACAEPGASVARIAMAHGLNANLVHKWRRRAARGHRAVKDVQPIAEFVSVPVQPTAAAMSTGDQGERVGERLRGPESSVRGTGPSRRSRRVSSAARAQRREVIRPVHLDQQKALGRQALVTVCDFGGLIPVASRTKGLRLRLAASVEPHRVDHHDHHQRLLRRPLPRVPHDGHQAGCGCGPAPCRTRPGASRDSRR